MLGALLDEEQVAAHFGASVGLVRKLARNGSLPFIKVGRLTRYDPADVAAFVAGNRHVARREMPQDEGASANNVPPARRARPARPAPSRNSGRTANPHSFAAYCLPRTGTSEGRN